MVICYGSRRKWIQGSLCDRIFTSWNKCFEVGGVGGREYPLPWLNVCMWRASLNVSTWTCLLPRGVVCLVNLETVTGKTSLSLWNLSAQGSKSSALSLWILRPLFSMLFVWIRKPTVTHGPKPIWSFSVWLFFLSSREKSVIFWLPWNTVHHIDVISFSLSNLSVTILFIYSVWLSSREYLKWLISTL